MERSGSQSGDGRGVRISKDNIQSDVNIGNALEVEIAYTDTMGKREVVEKEVDINTMGIGSESMGSKSLGMGRTNPIQQVISTLKWVGIGLTLLIVGIVAYKKGWYKKLFSIYRKYKKKRKLRK